MAFVAEIRAATLQKNDGAYRIRLGINEFPTSVPEPGTLLMLTTGMLLMLGRSKLKLGA